MGPVTRIARSTYIRGLRSVEAGDLDAVLGQFHPGATLYFAGDTPLGARLRGRPEVRMWFERFRRLLPSPRFDVRRLVVSGPPWRQQLAAHVFIRGTVAGDAYQNQFAHFLTLRWGKVIDDIVLEDTQMWAAACRRLAAAGVAEAAEGPMGHGPAEAAARTANGAQ